MNKRYVRGRSFEYYVKKAYEEKGFLVVRSAGSRGRIDLVAISKEGKVYMIQCKIGSLKSVSKSEILSLLNLANEYNSIPVLALKVRKKRRKYLVIFLEGASLIMGNVFQNSLLRFNRKV
jgi:Holliday junction resolvase